MRQVAVCFVLFLCSSLTRAGEYEVTAECRTAGGTKADGKRVSCTSAKQKITASKDEFFNPSDKDSIVVTWISQRGDCDYHIEWSDYAEIFPGLKLPRTITFWVDTRSPKVPPVSNIGVGGSAEAKLKAKSIKKPG